MNGWDGDCCDKFSTWFCALCCVGAKSMYVSYKLNNEVLISVLC